MPRWCNQLKRNVRLFLRRFRLNAYPANVDPNEASSAQPYQLQYELPTEHRQRWTECTYHARSCALTLDQVVDPRPGTPLTEADSFYEWEKASIWVRNYLCAAAEHLCMWADMTAPYKFHPEAKNDIRPRPSLLLARAGLEASAHALWLLEASTPIECAQRHMRLMHRDFTYHHAALVAGGKNTAHIDERIENLEARCAALSIPTAPKHKPPGYEKLVRLAALATSHDEDRWAYLWNAASGAGHGQNWFGIEGFELMTVIEYEPGYFRTIALPDVDLISDMLDAACDVLQWGTMKWLLLGGRSPDLMRRAARDVFERMPKLDGAPDRL